MLKRMPERALKSRESFQVSFSGRGKIRIAEKHFGFGGWRAFPKPSASKLTVFQCMQNKAHSEHGER